MKQVDVRDLQHHLGRYLDEVEVGGVLEVRRRKKVVARLVPHVPDEPAEPWPDLMQRLIEIYPNGPIEGSGSALIYADRDREAGA